MVMMNWWDVCVVCSAGCQQVFSSTLMLQSVGVKVELPELLWVQSRVWLSLDSTCWVRADQKLQQPAEIKGRLTDWDTPDALLILYDLLILCWSLNNKTQLKLNSSVDSRTLLWPNSVIAALKWPYGKTPQWGRHVLMYIIIKYLLAM